MRALVTGGAGHVGSRLCTRLVQLGHTVIAYDNLMLGRREFVAPLTHNPNFTLLVRDLLKDSRLDDVVDGCDVVFHLAANSDISQSGARTDLDLEYGLLATHRVLDSIRRTKVKNLVFSSSSAVYGEARLKPTAEDYGPLEPISLYGASKLAAEGYISAFSHHYDFRSFVFRFANIVGPNLTHGVIFDFLRKLARDPTRLEVLGNGTQKKSYLHVDDCVSGMLAGLERGSERVNFINLTADGVTQVKDIAHWVCAAVSPQAKILFQEGDRGWVGDVPYTWLSPKKIFQLGWRPQRTSDDSVRQAIQENFKVYGS